MGYKVPVGISNRHIHLSAGNVEDLFGKGYKLTSKKSLDQPKEFAAEERVDVIGPKGMIKGVRVVGPVREVTQLEISMTDARTLGLKAPVKESWHHDGTPGCKLVGPCGEAEIEQGVIVQQRHIHFDPKTAAGAGVKDKEVVRVKFEGERGLIFDNCICRVSDNYLIGCHIDTDEANAAGAANGDMCEILK